MTGRLLRGPETIAGIDTVSLSEDELIAMKVDLQGQLASRRSEIEGLRAAAPKGQLDTAEWHGYMEWRGKAASLVNVIEKELALRRSAHKASLPPSPGLAPPRTEEQKREQGRKVQIANLAALLLADQILDDGDATNLANKADDAVRIARLSFQEVWTAIDRVMA